jgi:hypothetical protein
MLKRLRNHRGAALIETVRNYMQAGKLTYASTASISVVRNVPFGGTTASRVSVDYPFQFIVLNPVAKLVRKTTTVGTPLTMHSSALMRNE